MSRIFLPNGQEYIVDSAVGPRPPMPDVDVCLAIVRLTRPSIIVEVGVWYGETTACLASLLPPGAVLYVLELSLLPIAREIVAAWGVTDRVVFVEGDSRQTAHTLPAGIGFAYIDGNHEPDGVQADFETIWPKMASNGIMAFHDVSGNVGVREWLPRRFPENAVPGVVYIPGGMGLVLIQKGPRFIVRCEDGGIIPWPTA